MKIFAQQGYGTGANGGRISAGLAEGYLDGVIFSPKDSSKERLTELLKLFRDEYPEADRLFDPQYYASLLAHDDGCRLGKLESEDYDYFRPRRRGELERESAVLEDLEKCLVEQARMGVSAVVAPNIVIRRSFNSIESVISKNFLRHASAVWAEIGDERKLYVTLAMDAEALQDTSELDDFLTDITLLSDRPDGFYLLVNNLTSTIDPSFIDPRTLAGWMMVNHALSLNQFEVINGYSDFLAPFLAVAGGSGGATGWWNNLKVFSLDRFQANTGMARRPVPRYFSKSLLHSIRFDELHRLRMRFPAVLNALGSDGLYSLERGSRPRDQIGEVLQSWDSIKSFSVAGGPSSIEDCEEMLRDAEELYSAINAAPGFRLNDRSDDAHIDALKAGLQLFKDLT